MVRFGSRALKRLRPSRRIVAAEPGFVAFLTLLIVGYVAAAGTSYYVGPLGNDSASGTSPDEAWATLGRASWQSYGSGDVLYLARGAVWRDDPLSLSLPDGNFRLDSFGNLSLPRPIIETSRSTATWTVCVSLHNMGANIDVRQLHIGGCSRGIILDAEATTARTMSNITIQDCYFRDIRHPFDAFQVSEGQWGAAIQVDFSEQQGTVEGLSVQNNVGLRLDTFFQSRVVIEGLFMDANTVAQCAYNCYSPGQGSDLRISNSVWLRDSPASLFMYGTTDIIIGNVQGDNVIENCDFNARGEFMGGPDGCAIDFEVGSSGFRIVNNTVSRSYGAGIMVFGHAVTAQNFLIADNVFIRAGCVQVRSDHAGIALMCPNGDQPSGKIVNNHFETCQGVPAIWNNTAVPGCGKNVIMDGNTVDSPHAVPQPIISAIATDSTGPTGTVVVQAVVPLFDAPHTIRFTIDGSRPTELSPVFPSSGLQLDYPGQVMAINARAFAPSMLPSVTNGFVFERYTYCGQPGHGPTLKGMRGSFDELNVDAAAMTVGVVGWAVDPNMRGGGLPPIPVKVYVDHEEVASVVARVDRPDLPKAGVAPNPNHGFSFNLPADVGKALLTGTHTVDVVAYGSPSSFQGFTLPSSPKCLCNGKVCPCA